MKFRQWFLKFTIQKQITVGITLISIMVCLLIFSLSIINCYAFISKASSDAFFELERKDDEYFSSLVGYYDFSIGIWSEMIKVKTQLARTIQIEYYRFKNIYKYIDSTELNKFFTPAEDGQSSNYKECKNNIKNCSFYYYNFNNNPIDEDEKKSLLILIPLLHYQIFNKETIVNVSSFQFSSYKNKIDYIFPYPSINLQKGKYNLSAFSNNINLMVELHNKLKEFLYGRLNNINEVNANFSDISLNNPYIHLNIEPYLLNTPYTKEEVPNCFVISYNFGENTTCNTPDNILLFGLSNFVVDELSSEISSYFKNIYILSISSNNEEAFLNEFIITNKTCLYFKKISSIYTGDNFAIDNTYKMKDCFINDKLNESFSSFFKVEDINLVAKDTSNLLRKAFITVQLKNCPIGAKELKFKVFQIYLPYRDTRVILSSIFYESFVGNSFFFKNHNEITKMSQLLNYQLFGFFCFEIFYSFVFWIIILFVMNLKGYLLSREITSPLNELLKRISYKEGRYEEDDDNKAKKSKKSDKVIEYKFDKDINDLFHICDSYIKGGFKEEETKKKIKTKNIYNTISYIKSNNLIINEKMIFTTEEENKKGIFEYKSNFQRNILKDYPTKGTNSSLGILSLNSQKGDFIDFRKFFEITEVISEKAIAKAEKNILYDELDDYLNCNEKIKIQI